jgi:uncharacterized protein YbjT (DUF2867 family)
MKMERTMRVALFGATGAAGSGVLRRCLADDRVAEVIAVTRRPLDLDASKLKAVICSDFLDLEPVAERLAGVDVCFYALGISQMQVPDPARYRAITYDFTLAAARTLLARSPQHTFHFVSGQGDDPSGRSRMMWARVKGETEVALQRLGPAGLVCWRPAYIHPLRPRANLHWSERLTRTLYPLLRGFQSLSVSADDLGRAMIQAAAEGLSEGVIENRDIRVLAARYGSTPP